MALRTLRNLNRIKTMAFVPTSRSEVQTWLDRFLAINDTLDVSKLDTVYTKNATVKFGNRPIIQGLENIQNFFVPTWSREELMHHDVDSFDMIDNRIYQECRVTWKVKNDPEKETIVLSAIAVLHLATTGEEKGLVSHAAYYMDGAPLNAALKRSP
ncbi:uncharacterized protein F4822DRAFT_388995 [Hypoxylon trugodes]|uniref:uncharacterized protein n=1 Tax=Hypoxylon trugodes TaxID=326681 RepID=UPI00219BA151|nr:uncharacterized protein F4822DRAFT_388995 [Hypoxylon trugodes]KAI1391943.1 hypothetical protein F4822DRAFT_388995 [Hypoxylon trugodes]